ncbi:tubulin-specific chaperone C [Tribolium castaneum]|uniref:Tubulin-specific chaperone C n=1 Tax=Tribolium castaneum TaxID=7070 RepID=D2A1K6_TRICA|nr:PREDICTED: tubulin-specific chaperone C [Tribolium castaneum]EFA02681.1 Tubulin-specific chaperone C-like Protein [Tribolium castaneum]|eukprot:XP_969186.1 PREDICTED: tubulin-specific chaperone C [Tribolium castaneum]
MQVMEGSVDKISLIAQRDYDRKLGLQKQKETKESQSADTEKLAYFNETFSNKRQQIENFLTQSSDLDKAALPQHFDTISKEILLLQKYVANSNIFLRSYDIKKCHESLQELTNKLKQLEENLLPKKKFGFKNKQNVKPVETKKEKDEVDFHKVAIVAKECGFANKTGETLTMKNEIFKKDITVEKLENCTVKLFGSPSTLHLNQLKNCRVFTGPVSTSIFAENCTNCTLVIACQQLRLHSSSDVDIYLHVTSRAIMEDCHDIFLAPYNWDYDNLESDFKNSGLDRNTNNWKCVDDFNWLNVERQSPNWSLLDEGKLVKNWDNS